MEIKKNYNSKPSHLFHDETLILRPPGRQANVYKACVHVW